MFENNMLVNEIAVLRQSTTVEEAAAKLGVKVRALYRRFAKHGLTAGAFVGHPIRVRIAESIVEAPRALSEGHTNILIGGDFHIPLHDPAAVDAFIEAIRVNQPEIIVLLGDVLDCSSISRFDHSPTDPPLQAELDIAKGILLRIVEVTPIDSRIVYTFGNHEGPRLEKWLMRNPGLFGLNVLTIQGLLGLDELGIEYLPYGTPFIWGDCMFYHGSKLSQHAGYAAKAEMETTRHTGLIFTGHTHRCGHVCRTDSYGKVTQAWECGTLADPAQAVYMTHSPVINWQRAYTLVSGTMMGKKQVIQVLL